MAIRCIRIINNLIKSRGFVILLLALVAAVDVVGCVRVRLLLRTSLHLRIRRFTPSHLSRLDRRSRSRSFIDTFFLFHHSRQLVSQSTSQLVMMLIE